MSRSILVGYDPRTGDRAPVHFGIAAARFTGAPLTVACVSDPSRRADEDMLADAGEATRALRSELEAEDVAIEVRQIEGASAARALHETAEADDAGLMVVGSSNRGAVGRVLPGSTAERLMQGAPCPVAVVPHGWEAGGGLQTIGAAYADTTEGREALRSALALARRAGAALRVLTAVKSRVGMFAETEPKIGVQRGRSLEDVEGAHLAEAEAAAREAVAQLDGAGVEVDVGAYLDDPADALIRVSEHLDLLVCGSRGYGPLRAVLLGGVSRRVTAEARCPVVVLPRGVTSALEDLIAEPAP